MFSNLVIKRILFVILSTVIAHSTTHFCNAQNSEESENQKTVVIPLVGKVGFVFGLDAPESKWFNAELIEELLKKAKKDRDNVTKIIFEIDSPGGYVSEERLICDLIQKYREEFEIVAYPHNAFSAACTIVMTCDRLVVSSDTNIGGAVILSGDGTALEDGNAADKKMASIDAVQVRTFYENANRPGVLADAFGIVKAELWFNNDSSKFSNESHIDEESWVKVDGSDSILTLTGQQLLKYKLSSKKVDSLSPYYEYKHAEDWSKEMDKLLKSALKDIRKWREEMDDIWDNLNDMIDWTDKLNVAYMRENHDEYHYSYKNLWFAVFKSVKDAKQLYKDYERGKYPFQIISSDIRRLNVIINAGQAILEEAKYEYESLTRHIDELIDAYNQYLR